MARADESDTGARSRRSRRTGVAKEAGGESARAASQRTKGARKKSAAAGGSKAEAGSETEADGPTFEAALDRLEEVVDRLEGGELELEAALESFEEGVRLTRHCAEQLDTAERRIEILMKEGADWVARPFGDDSPDDADPDASDEGWED